MSTANVAIIDSGGANIASLQYALQRLGHTAVLTTDSTTIEDAERVILPGVGAARNAMDTLLQHNLIETIRGLSQPVLGICLGMQLLTDGSEEDNVECLGIIPGIAKKLPASIDWPVPNMGWCPVQKSAEHAALDYFKSGDYFYFIHSYAMPESEYTLAMAEHAEPFAAMIGKNNFLAAQFHPERSSAAGSSLLNRFLEWTP
jgi:glutamine amidotransferase